MSKRTLNASRAEAMKPVWVVTLFWRTVVVHDRARGALAPGRGVKGIPQFPGLNPLPLLPAR
jgi:hypothetical protein